jgi:glycosyltransferase involved in cell wall biosynthesis
MKPKISIICPVFNAEKFIKGTIETILAQNYQKWELLVMDGGSNDATLSILERYTKEHSNIRFYSTPDEGSWDAIWKGIDRAEGEFIGFTYASDGYINNNWLSACAEEFDRDATLSLVWGIPFDMTEKGELLGPHFAYAQFLSKRSIGQRLRTYGSIIKRMSPRKIMRLLKNREYSKAALAVSMAGKGGALQKKEWFLYWLRTGLPFPDANMIVNKKVFIDCTPRYQAGSRVVDTFHDFFFNFNARGYFAKCLPTPANYGRLHGSQITERRQGEIVKNRGDYFRAVSEFKKKLKAQKSFSFIDKDKNNIASTNLSI